jgi:hypothetical protein
MSIKTIGATWREMMKILIYLCPLPIWIVPATILGCSKSEKTEGEEIVQASQLDHSSRDRLLATLPKDTHLEKKVYELPPSTEYVAIPTKPIAIYDCSCELLNIGEHSFGCQLALECSVGNYRFRREGDIYWYYGKRQLETIYFYNLVPEKDTMKFGEVSCSTSATFHRSSGLKGCSLAKPYSIGGTTLAPSTEVEFNPKGSLKRATIYASHRIGDKTYGNGILEFSEDGSVSKFVAAE